MTLDEIVEAARNHSETPSGVTRGDISVLSELLIALVGHVRALENITRMTDDKALERITELEEKVSAVYAGNSVEHRVLTSEMDRLRAENAELRKRIAELEEWWRCNLCFGSGFYVANSGAGKVECPYCGPSVSREKPTAVMPVNPGDTVE